MKRLVLTGILRLGRYAVLPVVALVGLLLVLWLITLDRYAVAALATAPIMFSIATAAGALALGILFCRPARTGPTPSTTRWRPACGGCGRSSTLDLRGEIAR